jgi:hypothetical protein
MQETVTPSESVSVMSDSRALPELLTAIGPGDGASCLAERPQGRVSMVAIGALLDDEARVSAEVRPGVTAHRGEQATGRRAGHAAGVGVLVGGGHVGGRCTSSSLSPAGTHRGW